MATVSVKRSIVCQALFKVRLVRLLSEASRGYLPLVRL